MKVKELIAALSAMDPELEVGHCHADSTGPVNEVNVDEVTVVTDEDGDTQVQWTSDITGTSPRRMVIFHPDW